MRLNIFDKAVMTFLNGHEHSYKEEKDEVEYIWLGSDGYL